MWELLQNRLPIKNMEMLRESLDKLHKYHNSKSKYFSGDYPRITFEERIEKYRKNAKLGEYRIELLADSETNNIIGFYISYIKKHEEDRCSFC